MPKGRYRIMRAYMPQKGTLGLDMMLRTCTVQVNLDYSSEADMVTKMRVGAALQPLATALWANSPFTEGKPNGFSATGLISGHRPTRTAAVCLPSFLKMGLDLSDGLITSLMSPCTLSTVRDATLMLPDNRSEILWMATFRSIS